MRHTGCVYCKCFVFRAIQLIKVARIKMGFSYIILVLSGTHEPAKGRGEGADYRELLFTCVVDFCSFLTKYGSHVAIAYSDNFQ